MAGRLEGKVCIVTGGTSGIGKACTEAFLREGAKVVFVARRDAGFDQEKALQAQGYDCMFIQADLQKEEDCRKVVPATVEKFGTVDVLMNNAGYGTFAPVIAADPVTDWDNVFDLNIRSYFLLIQDALKIMVPKKQGNIINLASIGGYTAMPMQLSYAATKAGVIHMTRSIAVEYARYGIRCNSISPGLTITELVPAGSEVEGLLKSIVPGRNSGSAEGVANAAVFCASDETPFMTGADIVIDGGVTCGRCIEPPEGFLDNPPDLAANEH